MSTGDEFERWLLDSAREDALPAGGAEQAWARFAAATGAVGTAVAGTPSAARLGASKATAAKWLLIGALGGGATVALWLRPTPPKAVTTAPVASVTVAPSVAPPPSAEPVPVVQIPAPEPSAVAARLEAHEIPPKMRSTLAAEVALLDSVRRSLANGAHDESLRTLSLYERRFPSGLLASDAEVLTIEALSAKGEADTARARAIRFLAKHPNDPHTERVRTLAEKRRTP